MYAVACLRTCELCSRTIYFPAFCVHDLNEFDHGFETFAPLPPPLPDKPIHDLVNGTTVASPPYVEARGVRWPGTQHAREERCHPAARLNPEEHGEYLTTHAA